MKKVKAVPDFLPTPDELVLKENKVRVTLDLTEESVEFFKKEASRHHTKYQQLIRTLLNKYAMHYKK